MDTVELSEDSLSEMLSFSWSTAAFSSFSVMTFWSTLQRLPAWTACFEGGNDTSLQFLRKVLKGWLQF